LGATRRSFNKDFLLALAADFKKHGAAAIEKVRETQSAAYLKVCALLVPREMKLERSGGVKDLTDEQIERSIELIKEMLAQREAGANAKVIDGVETVPSRELGSEVGFSRGAGLTIITNLLKCRRKEWRFFSSRPSQPRLHRRE
jgi:hypothetical protein